MNPSSHAGAAPGPPLGASVRVKYGIHPGGSDAPRAPCTLPPTTSFSLPPLDSKLVTCQLTLGQGASPPKTSAVPLSILELQSVDEKSKSAVTKSGLLSSTVLTMQSWNKKKKKKERGEGLPGCKHWDC